MPNYDSEHFACAAIWRRHGGSVEFLVMDVVSPDHRGERGQKQTKFPGGCQRKHNDPVDVTLRREIAEETFLAFMPESAKQIAEFPVRGARHTKYCFLIPYEECQGELRKEILVDDGDEMSPPYWVDFRWLAQDLWRTHQNFYKLAVEELQNQGVL